MYIYFLKELHLKASLLKTTTKISDMSMYSVTIIHQLDIVPKIRGYHCTFIKLKYAVN